MSLSLSSKACSFASRLAEGKGCRQQSSSCAMAFQRPRASRKPESLPWRPLASAVARVQSMSFWQSQAALMTSISGMRCSIKRGGHPWHKIRFTMASRFTSPRPRSRRMFRARRAPARLCPLEVIWPSSTCVVFGLPQSWKRAAGMSSCFSSAEKSDQPGTFGSSRITIFVWLKTSPSA